MHYIDEIILSLDREPERWCQHDRLTITRDDGLEIWVDGRGMWKPQRLAFSFWESHKMTKALRRWKKKLTLELIHIQCKNNPDADMRLNKILKEVHQFIKAKSSSDTPCGGPDAKDG